MAGLLGSLMLVLLLSQTNFQEELKQDAVVIKDRKMVLEDYGLVKGKAPDGSDFSLQVRYYSEAPNSVILNEVKDLCFFSLHHSSESWNPHISRDNFVALPCHSREDGNPDKRHLKELNTK